MTIAMAAITADGHIVAVADRLISFGDFAPGTDAILKGRGICDDWGCFFAAQNANLFHPFSRMITAGLMDGRTGGYAVEEVKANAARAYQELFNAEFSAKILSPYRFADVAEFRREGLGQLGVERYNAICDRLENFDIGLSIIIFGYDLIGTQHIFQVANPGICVDNDLLGVSIAGSGQLIALGALVARGQLRSDVPTTVCQLLEAKFAAEAATGVGRATTVAIFGRGDKHGFMVPPEIEQLREIWNQSRRAPINPLAIKVVAESSALAAARKTDTPLLDKIEEPERPSKESNSEIPSSIEVGGVEPASTALAQIPTQSHPLHAPERLV